MSIPESDASQPCQCRQGSIFSVRKRRGVSRYLDVDTPVAKNELSKQCEADFVCYKVIPEFSDVCNGIEDLLPGRDVTQTGHENVGGRARPRYHHVGQYHHILLWLSSSL